MAKFRNGQPDGPIDPCPFCGSTKYEYRLAYTHIAVICSTCGARGPTVEPPDEGLEVSKAKARDFWNSRVKMHIPSWKSRSSARNGPTTKPSEGSDL